VTDTAVSKSKKSAWPLFAIIAVTVVPIVAAYVAYFTGLGVPHDTVNEGRLVNPAINIKTLVAGAEGDIPALDNNLNWRLLIPVPEHCGESCQQDLYVTRQVHIRLADKAERLERFAVNIGGDAGEQFLQEIQSEQPGLKHFSIPQSRWDEWLRGTNVPGNLSDGHYYLLVDQVGFAMMFYTKEHTGNQLLKDLKRVLRYSPGG